MKNNIEKCIPLAFDQSLSYYECICNITNYINKDIIPVVNETNETVIILSNKFDELKNYVDDNMLTKDIDDLTYYTKTSDLSEVALSGNYNDLSNKPTIPTVPTNISAFNNDSGYITKDVNDLTNYTLTNNLSSVATSGNYNDLSNKPTIPDVSNFITKDVNDLTNYTLTSNLSSVATSGNYNDLSNKPTIPIANNMAILNGANKTITGNSAWTQYNVGFTSSDTFITSDSSLFEFDSSGIKCKFSGTVLILRAMTLDATCDTKEFDLVDEYGWYNLVSGINKNNFSIKTVSSNEVINLKYVGEATDFTIYTARIIVIRLN